MNRLWILVILMILVCVIAGSYLIERMKKKGYIRTYTADVKHDQLPPDAYSIDRLSRELGLKNYEVAKKLLELGVVVSVSEEWTETEYIRYKNMLDLPSQ